MPRPIYNNFTAGEISPSAEGRVDLEMYFRSARTVQNFIPKKQGGLFRRPGTMFVAYAKEDASNVRLIPLQLASGNYIFEAGGASSAYMRVYKDRARIESVGVPVEVTGGWLAAGVDAVRYVQNNTTMFLVHRDYNVKQLTRVSDTSWTLADATFIGSGAPTFNVANKRPGSITMFEQRMVLGGSYDNPNKIWLSKTGSVLDFGTASLLSFEIYHQLPITLQWLASKAAIIFGADNAEGILTGNNAPLSTTNYQVQVQTTYGCAPVQGIAVNEKILYVPTQESAVYDFGYLDSIQGWFADDLNIFSEHLFASTKGMAIQRRPDTILWVWDDDGNLFGCTYDRRINTFAWFRCEVDGLVRSVAVIPSSVCKEDEVWLAVDRDINGTIKTCIEHMMPQSFGTDISDAFFVDSGVTHVAASEGKAITGWYSTTDGIEILCAGNGFINGDKVRISRIFGPVELNNKEYTVLESWRPSDSFILLETGGYSAWSATTTYHPGNIVFLESHFICIAENVNVNPWGADEYWTLWPSVYVSGGVATKVDNYIDGLSHLEGETVSVLTDGAIHPQRTVENGAIDLQVYSIKTMVGRPYRSMVKLQRPEVGSTADSTQGLIKKIGGVFLRLFKSSGCKVGFSEDTLDSIIFRNTTDPLGAPPPLYSGDKQITFNGSWDTQGDLLIVQDDPLPLNILAVIPDVEVSIVQ